MAQQNTLASLAAKLLELDSDMKVLKQSVHLLTALIGTQLFHTKPELEAFLRRFAEYQRNLDPDKESLDAALRILRQNIPFSES